MARLRADPARSRRIADNAYESFHRRCARSGCPGAAFTVERAYRYTSPAAIACYWRSVLRTYASCMRYDPQADATAVDVESVLLMGAPTRSSSFTSLSHSLRTGTTDWEPHR